MSCFDCTNFCNFIFFDLGRVQLHKCFHKTLLLQCTGESDGEDNHAGKHVSATTAGAPTSECILPQTNADVSAAVEPLASASQSLNQHKTDTTTKKMTQRVRTTRCNKCVNCLAADCGKCASCRSVAFC